MKKLLIRYKVKSEKVAENESLVKAVYRHLHANPVDGFHYTTLKLADGVSFVHIALSETDEANAAFNALPVFKEFTANIKDRCDEPPIAGPAEVIGAFEFLIPSV